MRVRIREVVEDVLVATLLFVAQFVLAASVALAVIFLATFLCGCAELPTEVRSATVTGEARAEVELDRGRTTFEVAAVVLLEGDEAIPCPVLSFDLELDAGAMHLDISIYGVPPDAEGAPIDSRCYERLGPLSIRPRPAKRSDAGAAWEALERVGALLWDFGLRLLPTLLERYLQAPPHEDTDQLALGEPYEITPRGGRRGPASSKVPAHATDTSAPATARAADDAHPPDTALCVGPGQPLFEVDAVLGQGPVLPLNI